MKTFKILTALVVVCVFASTVSVTPSAGAATSAQTVGVARADSLGGIRWLLRNSNNGGGADINFLFGTAGTDFPVTGDWNGDGKTTIGLVRPSGNSYTWILRNSNSAGHSHLKFKFGNPELGDFPVVGDWNKDGKTTIGVVRPAGDKLRWYLRNSNSTGSSHLRPLFGDSETDFPVTGDWNGNRSTTIGVVRPMDDGSYRWYLRNSNSTGRSHVRLNYGAVASDFPITGDWDGNRTTTVGVVNLTGPSFKWLLRNVNSTGSAKVRFNYGGTFFTDFPVVGDWNG